MASPLEQELRPILAKLIGLDKFFAHCEQYDYIRNPWFTKFVPDMMDKTFVKGYKPTTAQAAKIKEGYDRYKIKDEFDETMEYAQYLTDDRVEAFLRGL